MGIDELTLTENVREEKKGPERMLREGNLLFRYKKKKKKKNTEAPKRENPGECGGKEDKGVVLQE